MASAASPPSKSSLSTWWKQLKKPHLRDDDLEYLSDSENLDRPLNSSNSNINYPQAAFSPDISEIPPQANPIFGVPLKQSVDYAWVPISLTDPETGEAFKYGHIPVVVAKCGRYLKKNATGVEGIFRLSGSARRIKELQIIFSTPKRYGKDLDWAGFNVHDAANVLRRYLNNLPEPIVPLKYYEQFRDPLREYPRVVMYLNQQSAVTSAALGAGASGLSLSPGYRREDESSLYGSVPKGGGYFGIEVASSIADSTATNPTPSPLIMGISDQSPPAQPQSSQLPPLPTSPSYPDIDTPLYNDINSAVDRYQHLISILPPLNRQLLMYILDLLSVFAAKAEENLMPAANLAAIFQPSILSHPNHDMSPQEYHLSRSAIEFLIQHSNKFLTHVENEAIRKHQEEKTAGKSIGDGNNDVIPLENGKDTNPLLVHRRRHSKSLSSVGSNPKIPLITSNSGSGTFNKPLSTPTNNNNHNPTPYQPSSQRSTSDENNGFLTTFKRTVSISKRPSQRRSISGSSVTSNLLLKSSKKPSISPNNSQSLIKGTSQIAPEIHSDPYDHDPTTTTGESKKSLSNLFSRKSKSPNRTSFDDNSSSKPDSNSNQSIDQAMLLLASADTSSTLPPPQPFLHHTNHSNSSLGSTSTGASDYDKPHDELNGSPNRKSKSKWRRSLMMFNMSGVGDSYQDLSNSSTTNTNSSSFASQQHQPPPPPPSQPDLVQSGDNVSPASSAALRSQSPSRWFKKKPPTRGRSSSRENEQPSP